LIVNECKPAISGLCRIMVTRYRSVNGRKTKNGSLGKPENAMNSHARKAGAALILLSLGGVPALAQNQAKDLTAGASKTTEIVLVKTTPEQVAFQPDQSGRKMSPMPDTGNIAMLITGVCLAGVAASRRKVAA
jgi:hypothetical protein